MTISNEGFIYRFKFKTLPKGEGGTNGAVYVKLGDFKNQLPGLIVNPELLSGSNSSEAVIDAEKLQLPDGSVPMPALSLVNVPKYLKIDTADAPGDNSFEQRDIDICYFFFDKTFELPAAPKLSILLISGTAKDHWTFECSVSVLGRKLQLANVDYPKRTKYVDEGKSRPTSDEVMRPFASTHIDKNKQIVRLGELPAHVLQDELQFLA